MLKLFGQSITFFTPAYKVGGTATLYTRLTEYFVSQFDLNIVIIDYPDGFVANYLNDHGIRHQLCSFNEDYPIQLPQDTFLVMDLSQAFLVNRWLIDGDRIRCLLWSLHPANSLVTFPLNPIYKGLDPKQTARLTSWIDRGRKKKVRTLLTHAHQANALSFMDVENYYWNKTIFDFAIEPRYLPVPIPDVQTIDRQHLVLQQSRNLQLGWLGRIATDKIASLVALIKSANEYAQSRKQSITIHIIGNGSQEFLLDRVHVDEQVTIIRCGTLIEKDLITYLKNNITILFGMGTSCLEAARLQIPTVLIPIDYHKIPLEYFKMMWLYQTPDYLLGWHWKNPPTGSGLQSFEQILDSVVGNESELIDIGQRCHKYVTTHHSISRVADQLINLISNNTGFSIGDIYATGVLNYSSIERTLLWGKDQVKKLQGASKTQ